IKGAVPEAVTEKVTVCPISTDWLTGWFVIAGATATPVPAIWIVSGELNCALRIEALPETVPVAMGAKPAVNVKVLPGDKLSGRDAPPMLKPAPVAVTWEIVTAKLPEFVTLRL